MTNNDVRQKLECLIRQNGESYVSVSRLLGRNAAYIQQFIKRGIPAKLDEHDRHKLARHFGVCEASLGGQRVEHPQSPAAVRIPVLVAEPVPSDTCPDHTDTENCVLFDRGWLSRIVGPAEKKLGMYEVVDDFMAPTIKNGNEVLVDLSQDEPVCNGIYLLHMGTHLSLGRLKRGPCYSISILYDNPLHHSWTGSRFDSLNILGRAIWTGRRV